MRESGEAVVKVLQAFQVQQDRPTNLSRLLAGGQERDARGIGNDPGGNDPVAGF